MDENMIPLAQMTITFVLDENGDRQILVDCPEGLHPDTYDGIAMCEVVKDLFITGEIFELDEAGDDD